jgi:hypothetical protein
MYPQTLTNLQLEIVKLYSTEMERQDLLELKQVLANFFAQKAIQEVGHIWDEQHLTDDDMEAWLDEG